MYNYLEIRLDACAVLNNPVAPDKCQLAMEDGGTILLVQLKLSSKIAKEVHHWRASLYFVLQEELPGDPF